MVKQGLFSKLSKTSLIAVIGAGIVVGSVNSSFAGGNDRGQKNHRCADLVKAKNLPGDQRKAEWTKCQNDPQNYKENDCPSAGRFTRTVVSRRGLSSQSG